MLPERSRDSLCNRRPKGGESLHAASLWACAVLAGAFLLCILPGVLPGIARAQSLVFSSGASIETADLDGSNRRPFVTVSDPSTPLVDQTVDASSQNVYWLLQDSMANETVFYRASPKDKTPHEIFRKAGSDIRCIAVDGQAGKIYWAGGGTTDAIQRADLDGTNIETLVSSIGIGLFDIVVDPAANEMYWTSTQVYTQKGTIHRATLDGLQPDSLVTGQGWPAGICLDRDRGWVYWSDNFWGEIKRARLVDGSDVESVVPGVGRPIGIALDPVGGKLYWVDPLTNRMQWSDLDGQNVANLLSVGAPERLDIRPGNETSVAPATWSDRRRQYR